jgi:hypothetical protein
MGIFNELSKLIIGPITGAALALIVNRLFEIRNKTPKLIFGIRYAYDVAINPISDELSDSGYQFFILNIGIVPVFIQKILVYEKNIKNDILLELYPYTKNELTSVMPFANSTFLINNQEYNKRVNFSKKIKKNNCKVMAYSLDKKQYKSIIDLRHMNLEFRVLPCVVNSTKEVHA